MNERRSRNRLICLLSMCMFAGAAFAQKPAANLVTTIGYGNSTTATIPAGTPVVKAEAWGAGGGGGYVSGSALNYKASGGGGGGAYSANLIPIGSNKELTLTIGAGGSNSSGTAVHGQNSIVSYNGTTYVEAGGGKTVTGTNNTSGANGGQAITGKAGWGYSGGKGGNGRNGACAGGGGAAADACGNGGNGTSAVFGNTHVSGGTPPSCSNPIAGAGGTGYTGASSPSSGAQYGGGGSGVVSATLGFRKRAGGNGAKGYVRLTYMTFVIKDTILAQGICSGNSFTLIPVGDYPEGATFTWTTTSSSVTVSGNGSTPSSNVSATLVNNTNTSQNVTFNCTATYTDNTYGLGEMTETFTATVTVFAPMHGGAIADDQMVCAGKTINQLVNVTSGTGGSNPEYQWQASANNSTWTNVDCNTEYYTPTQSGVYYFRRQIVDATCGSAYSNTLTVTNLNPYQIGTLSGNVRICPETNHTTTLNATASCAITDAPYTIYWQSRRNSGEWNNLATRVIPSGNSDSYEINVTPGQSENGDTLEYRYAVKFFTCDSVLCNGSYKVIVKKIVDYTPMFSDATVILWNGTCDTNLTNMPAPVLTPAAYSVEGPTMAGDLTELTPGDYVFGWTVTDSCGYVSSYQQNVKVQFYDCTGHTSINGVAYSQVRIGCECWLAENLRIDANEAVYYQDNTDFEKFGKLYNWNDAVGANNTVKTSMSGDSYIQGVCPDGWAIPTPLQFNTMRALAGSDEAIKSDDVNAWLPDYAGNNLSGFGAMGAGYYAANQFQRMFGYTCFWTSETSATNTYEAKVMELRCGCGEFTCLEKSKSNKYSVRCVRVQPIE